jgi:glycerophosphoryl diester phosphodiesterase
MKKTTTNRLRDSLLVFAHRGGGGRWPQNTLYAFNQAAKLGVDALETDIHTTADGVIVVCHDPTVDETTNGHGQIHGMTLAQLKQLDAGYRWTADGGQTFPFRGQGITIPTFEETAAAFPNLRINVDIKQNAPSIVEPFVQLLRRLGCQERVMVGSFHDRELRLFRRICPEVGTSAGVEETRLFYFTSLAGLTGLLRPAYRAFQVPEYAGRIHLVTPAFIRAAHARGIEVHVWTVDEEADMRRLIEWGVDGLVTDYPDRLMELLKAQ